MAKRATQAPEQDRPHQQLQLRDRDRERYGAPEWLDFYAGYDRLSDLDHDALKAIEEQATAVFDTASLMMFFGVEYPKHTLESWRMRAWLGMLAAGVDIKLADFTPNVFNILTRPRPGAADADPPAPTSES